MNNLSGNSPSSEKKIIDISLKLILVFILVAWCGMIIMPFVTVLLWSIILAITLYPVFDKLTGLLKGKKAISATIVSLIMLVVLLVPFVLMITSLVDEAKMLKEAFQNDTLRVSPPNAKVAEWPLIGERLFIAWKALNENLEATIMEHREELKVIFQKVIRALMGVTSNVLMFTGSIIIAGLMMAISDKAEKSTLQLSTRLTGDKGAEFLSMIVQTIRNVAKGIIGVAFIQFSIMGIAFLLAGVPFAGIWALVVLMLALVQLPTFLVALPVVIYMYSVKDPLPATLWAVVILLAGLSDNVLKPWLMGKGAPVPMLVIFLGSVGGFILSGFLGLFTGAIILSLGYKLGVMWLEASQEKDMAAPKGY